MAQAAQSSNDRAPAATSTLARIILVLVVAGLLLGGAGLVGASLMSPASLKERLDRSAAGGSAVRYTTERIEQILHRSRLAGGALVLCAAATVVLRRRAMRQIGGTLASIRRCNAEAPAGARALIRREPGHLALLLLIVLGGLGLRLVFLNQGARSDEAMWYLLYVTRPLPFILADYTDPMNHVLHTILAHAAVRLFGPDLWAIRLPALIAGTLLIPAVYAFVRTVYDRHAALLAAALIAVSPYLTYYSVNSRGYSLVCLAFIGTLTFGAAALRTRRPALWLAYAVTGALGFYTIPIMLFAAGGAGLWLLLAALLAATGPERVRRMQEVIAWSILMLSLTLLLYLPVLVWSGAGSMTGNQWVKPQALPDLLRWLGIYSGLFIEYSRTSIPTLIAAILAIGVAVAVVGDALERRRVSPLLAVALFAPLVLAVQRSAPFPRVWTFVLPLILALSAVGLVMLLKRMRLSESRLAAAAVAATVLLCGPIAWDVIQRRPESQHPLSAGGMWSEGGYFPEAAAMAAAIKEVAVPNDRVLSTWPARAALAYYASRLDLPGAMVAREGRGPPFTLAVLDAPLDAFNKAVTGDRMSEPLAESQMELIRQAPGAAFYRLNPPQQAGLK